MIDLSAVFDHIKTSYLVTILGLAFGKESKIAKILESMYSKTTYTMKGEENAFQTTSGVRQGGPESPNCYNMYADHVMNVFVERCEAAVLKFLEIPFKIPAEFCDIENASGFTPSRAF